MAQTPAHTDQQIIAAGLAIRARGEEPTRAKLHAELGRRGHPNSAWKAWTEYRDGAGSASAPDDLQPDDEALSPELKDAYQAHRNTLTALAERLRAETREPLERKLAALQDALGRAWAEKRDLEDLVDDLQRDVEATARHIEQLLAERSAPAPRLILPGRPG